MANWCISDLAALCSLLVCSTMNLPLDFLFVFVFTSAAYIQINTGIDPWKYPFLTKIIRQ